MFFSWEFWAFVAIVLLFHNVTRGRGQNAVLLVASYALYAYFDLRFLAVLIVATTVTYVAARRLKPDSSGRRQVMVVGILFNLGVLGFFKYANFFASTISLLLVRVGVAPNPVVLGILLPLGISFYSFRLLSYLFDVYNKRIDASASWLEVALFVSFFPQIASGPIERAPRFLPKLRGTRRLSQEQFTEGITYLLLGVFYKIAIADPLVATTGHLFDHIAALTSADALKGMILYSIQLYADFAGYSAMAIGVSTWFGLPAMENFRQPYFANSVIDFWTRWHISLSTWFRDYLFFPMTRSLLRRWGSKHSGKIQTTAYLVTMLLTGIWHGANWTFAMWGLLHGLCMAIERFLAGVSSAQPIDLGRNQQRLDALLNILITQIAVASAWIFFAAPSITDAFSYFGRLLADPPTITPGWWGTVLIPIVMLLFIDLLLAGAKTVRNFWQLRLVWRVGICTVVLLLLVLFGGVSREPFVYFRF